MAKIAASAMITELQRRVTQLSASDALAALNRGVRWVYRQGSFTFMVNTATLSVTNGASIAAPADMDDGKVKMLFNANGTEISRIDVSDLDHSNNFNTPSPTTTGSNVFDTYFIKTAFTSGSPTSTFYFYPDLSATPHSVSVKLIYHTIPVDLTNSASSYSNLPTVFDDLLIDLAEAEERRIYDVGETWNVVMARCQDQIKVLLDGYRTLTYEPGLLSESSQAVQEKTQLGRA